MPCNYNHRRLAEQVKAGIRAAGGTPMEFNTISVSDGVSMGTEGMKASPHQPRGRRRLDRARRARPPARRRRVRHRLRQDRSRRGDGARPARRPGADPLQRHDLSRHLTGSATPRSCPSSRRSGRTGRARSRSTSCTRWRTLACPGPGRLRRPVHRQHDVDGPRVPGPLAGRPQRHPGRGPGQGRGGPSQRRAGDGPRPARRAAIGVRHPRVARERDRLGRGDRRLDQRRPAPAGDRPRVRDRRSTSTSSAPIADRTPIVADMQPGGRYTASDLYDAGGVALVMRELLQAARPAPRDAPTVDGRTHRRDRRRRRSRPRARRSSSRSTRRSSRPAGWRSSAAPSRPTAAS